MDFFWSLLLVIVPVLWTIAMFIRDKVSRDYERNSFLMTRLSENQGIMIEHPELQEYICTNANEDQSFFLKPERVNDKDGVFFKAKNKVYNDLNLFDELLSLIGDEEASKNCMTKLYSWACRPNLIDEAIWLSYVKCKLRHPFYSSTLENEEAIFGSRLIKFWKDNKEEILKQPINALLW